MKKSYKKKELDLLVHETVMKMLALDYFEFDGGDDTRLFLEDSYHIDVYVNDVTEEEYHTMTDDLNEFSIQGCGYSIFAWNDVSGYDYWKREGLSGCGNYINITVNVENSDLVDIEKMREDALKAYDHFSVYHNADNHDFSKLNS